MNMFIETLKRLMRQPKDTVPYGWALINTDDLPVHMPPTDFIGNLFYLLDLMDIPTETVRIRMYKKQRFIQITMDPLGKEFLQQYHKVIYETNLIQDAIELKLKADEDYRKK